MKKRSLWDDTTKTFLNRRILNFLIVKEEFKDGAVVKHDFRNWLSDSSVVLFIEPSRGKAGCDS